MVADNGQTGFIRKTLSGIQYGSTSNNSIKNLSNNNNKISSNSHQVLRNIHRKRSVLKSLFNKVSGLQVLILQLYQNRDSDTGVFLWNYQEHVFFYRTSPDDCFWKIISFYQKRTQSQFLMMRIMKKGSEFVFWDQPTVDSWSFS